MTDLEILAVILVFMAGIYMAHLTIRLFKEGAQDIIDIIHGTPDDEDDEL